MCPKLFSLIVGCYLPLRYRSHYQMKFALFSAEVLSIVTI
ncbi:hypothetical protein AVDCRST_MAG94-5955 [uncultured Leptolyngbya sp.]|uniref:Uncharacterized protein n=1 Tax=uncultured Leptolyngbya sp. TaxID=332963 RepID=A0A6J4P3P9_9CYAN|nr:hypothetical protein AVDCRST_MAG94-5955 [uncultured Leptolyngbya sp.]